MKLQFEIVDAGEGYRSIPISIEQNPSTYVFVEGIIHHNDVPAFIDFFNCDMMVFAEIFKGLFLIPRQIGTRWTCLIEVLNLLSHLFYKYMNGFNGSGGNFFDLHLNFLEGGGHV